MSTTTSAAPAGESIQVVVDRTYVLHEKLGQGGMGAVYRATQRSSGHSVALKLVTADSSDEKFTTTSGFGRRRLALAREFQTLASLHHPHVVRVLGYGFDAEHGPYYTMELLPSAQTIVEAGRDRPLREKVQLLAQLLRALDYVHRRGIYHRDIKPNNVRAEG